MLNTLSLPTSLFVLPSPLLSPVLPPPLHVLQVLRQFDVVLHQLMVLVPQQPQVLPQVTYLLVQVAGVTTPPGVITATHGAGVVISQPLQL